MDNPTERRRQSCWRQRSEALQQTCKLTEIEQAQKIQEIEKTEYLITITAEQKIPNQMEHTLWLFNGVHADTKRTRIDELSHAVAFRQENFEQMWKEKHSVCNGENAFVTKHNFRMLKVLHYTLNGLEQLSCVFDFLISSVVSSSISCCASSFNSSSASSFNSSLFSHLIGSSHFHPSCVVACVSFMFLTFFSL